MANKYKVLAFFFLVAAGSYVLNEAVNYAAYTLEKNGNWESRKLKLKGVNGVFATMFTKNALHRNMLNISAWFGYQELLCQKTLPISNLQFKFQNYQKGPFAVYVHHTDTTSLGIFFNYKKSDTCCWFIADSRGGFLEKRDFIFKPSKENWQWSNAEIFIRNDTVTLAIDKAVVFTNTMFLPSNLRIGFRGGRYPVYVDDVVVRDFFGTKLFSDNFSSPFEVNKWTLYYLLFSLLLLPVLFSTKYQWALSLVFSFLIGFVVCYAIYYKFLSNRFITNADYINWHGNTVTFDSETTVSNRLDSARAKLQSTPAILIIGSSQAWGAGASGNRFTYPAQIEKQIHETANGTSVVVINAGICGATSEVLYKHYAESWFQFRPQLCVINLGNNDKDTTVFKKYIKAFLQLNKKENIKTLLVAEPNDYINDSLAVNHANMESIGKQYGVATVRPQHFLDSCSSTGFVWWDHVHMTDYGYEAIASVIAKSIALELQNPNQLPAKR
ncbi:MAG: SGNH/GDSL hydrolase family protein [Chitinophagales bacterium]|nr:SGNH/GDSL hydrolase family protein [Chitinophagales bacterium]